MQIKNISDEVMQREVKVGMRIFLVHSQAIGQARSYSVLWSQCMKVISIWNLILLINPTMSSSITVETSYISPVEGLVGP